MRTNYARFHVDHTAETTLCGMCGRKLKGEAVAHVVNECSKLAQTELSEGMITWHGISTGNFVVNVDWKELIAGMNRSQRD